MPYGLLIPTNIDTNTDTDTDTDTGTHILGLSPFALSLLL